MKIDQLLANLIMLFGFFIGLHKIINSKISLDEFLSANTIEAGIVFIVVGLYFSRKGSFFFLDGKQDSKATLPDTNKGKEELK